MNEDLHEAILRMAEALVGVTEAMTRIVDALPDRCIDEDEDSDLEIEDREPFDPADLAALASANQNQWRFYRDYLMAMMGTEFRAALLTDGYQFDRNHSAFDALRNRLESVDLARATFKSDEGELMIEDVTFDDFSATAYGCVVFSDHGPIVYYDFGQPKCGHGGPLTISSVP